MAPDNIERKLTTILADDGWRRLWSATLVGFLGVLIMVQPNGARGPAAAQPSGAGLAPT